MTITYIPFDSSFGFSSPGFSVDQNGNVTVKSLNITSVVTPVTGADFTVREVSGQFVFDDLVGDNPNISLTKGTIYKIDLFLTSLTFNIRDGSSDFNTGVKHTATNGTESLGSAAQGKQTGRITFAVPDTSPSLLSYEGTLGVPAGTIAVNDVLTTGVGSFTRLVVTGNVTQNGADAVISLAPSGTGTVTINPAGGGALNNMVIGDITPLAGTFTDIVGTTLTITDSMTINPTTPGTIDNMAIGSSVPSTGVFTSLVSSGTVTATNYITTGTGVPTIDSASSIVLNPSTYVSVSNKQLKDLAPATDVNDAVTKGYTDAKISAFAIAFGA